MGPRIFLGVAGGVFAGVVGGIFSGVEGGVLAETRRGVREGLLSTGLNGLGDADGASELFWPARCSNSSNFSKGIGPSTLPCAKPSAA
mmetsp:Transcript_146148/g.207165  ORF Transcript_146148/g.207165 Transcript_146148/m.207165 type:complete len:88 (+) Transcript_146148:396-659(+)